MCKAPAKSARGWVGVGSGPPPARAPQDRCPDMSGGGKSGVQGEKSVQGRHIVPALVISEIHNSPGHTQRHRTETTNRVTHSDTEQRPRTDRGQRPQKGQVTGRSRPYETTGLNLREGPSGPRCEQRAAHARRGSESKTECDVKTAQGYRLAKVACTLTALVGGQRPRRC